MKKKSIFKILFLFFTIPQSFCAEMQPSEQPQQRRYDDLSLEERQQIDQVQVESEQALEQLDQELPAIEHELQEQSRQNVDLTQKGLFHEFQETVLIQGPEIPLTDGIYVGLYGKDLLKLAFMVIDAYLDSYLKKNLFTVVLADFTKSLLEHKPKIAELIENLVYDEQNNLIWNEAYTELSSFITKHGFKPFRYFGDLNIKKVAQALAHLVISETSFGIQHQFFPPENQGIISEISHTLDEIHRTMNQDRPTLSLNFFLQAPLLYFFGISQLASSNAPFLRRALLMFSGCNHPFLNTYSF